MTKDTYSIYCHHVHVIHKSLKNGLQSLIDALGSEIPADEVKNYLGALDAFLQFLAHHHHNEDKFEFPVLSKHGFAVVDDLDAEHKKLHHHLDQLRTAAGGSSIDQKAVKDLLVSVQEFLVPHLQKEEDQITPETLQAKNVTVAELKQIQKSIMQGFHHIKAEESKFVEVMEDVSKKRIHSQDFNDLNLHPQFTLVSAITTKDPILKQISIYDLLSIKLESPKLVIINEIGGIQGVNHVYIERNDKNTSNLNSVSDDTKLIEYFLRNNNNKSCAIISSQESHQNLVQNLITEKPISLIPAIQNSDEQICSSVIPPTMFRIDIGCQTFDSLSKVDMEKLQALIKESFGKTATEEYWSKLDKELMSVTIAGDFDGALIVTSQNGHAYLDKFAIRPKSQGLGVADLLWNRLLLYENVFWRSRVGNPVNKWYFDRADGFLVKGKWILFYFGAKGLSNVSQYQDIVDRIPATFLD